MSRELTTEDFYSEIEHAATVAAPLFQMYGWTHFDSQNPITHYDLVNCITELVEHALEHFNRSKDEFPEAGVSSGRFSVNIKEFEDEQCLDIKLDLVSKSRFKEFTF